MRVADGVPVITDGPLAETNEHFAGYLIVDCQRTFHAQDNTELEHLLRPLALLFLCCHESLSASSQIALTLRAVGGLTTAEIASAFFVPEPRWPNGSTGPGRRSTRPR